MQELWLPHLVSCAHSCPSGPHRTRAHPTGSRRGPCPSPQPRIPPQGNTGAQEGPGPCKKHAKAPGIFGVLEDSKKIQSINAPSLGLGGQQKAAPCKSSSTDTPGGEARRREQFCWRL
ncbi:uncharacterized protein ACIBXB_018886 isoform 1-T1 [Morphnus guianensis]